MMKLTVREFDDFFEALHGHPPFPWQSMLLKQVAENGWPDLIDLPTAHGKTACMDVAVYALAIGLPTPRRIWFVVDRRIVVDEAYARAVKVSTALRYAHATAPEREKLRRDRDLAPVLASIASLDCPTIRAVASRLCELGGSRPLEVGRLRGGAPRKIAWAGNPAQPAIITSTVDQIGSRLLFRGYGLSDYRKPIDAALAGNDSVILLDEAHLARPFFQTVRAIERFRKKKPWARDPLPSPFKLIVMSATPPDGAVEHLIKFPSKKQQKAALGNELLKQRRSVPKPTELAIAKKPKLPKDFEAPVDDELVLDAASRAAAFASSGRKRIAVMVNRVNTARDIATTCQQLLSRDQADVVLLTGRLRPVDRDVLIRDYESKLKAGSTQAVDVPIILVTTQCLEVGADFSFDALITECASLDALRQRFGRLSRLGEFPDASGVILIRKGDIKPEDKLDEEKPADPIYGNALVRTWHRLSRKGKKEVLMGIDALQPHLDEITASGKLTTLLAPTRDAPILLPAYLDLLCQTFPRPAVEPDVSLFLHGIPPADHQSRAEVRVLWRDDLAIASNGSDSLWEDLVAGLPPLSGEMLQMPLSELRQVLTNSKALAESDGDIEGIFEPAVESDRVTKAQSQASTRFIIWRGRDNCHATDDVREICRGDVVVLPGRSGEIRPDGVVASPANPVDPTTFSQLLPNAKAAPDVYEQAFRASKETIRKLYRNPNAEFDEDAAIQSLVDSVTEEDGKLFKSPRLVKYAEGFYHITGKTQPAPVDRWESDVDEEDQLYNGESCSLEHHTRAVAECVLHLSHLWPEPLNAILVRAAELHDIGKVDPRFQYILNHGQRIDPNRPLAKSVNRLSRAQENKLYQLSKLPEGFRHELLSMQLAAVNSAVSEDGLPDLLLHLIASHHGRCRPFAPVVIDDDPKSVVCPTTSRSLEISKEQRQASPPHRLDSGITERFWRLTRRYGWWGLAYLEAILRCADMHASAYHEQEAQACPSKHTQLN
ncbi:MAG: type I-U CRISPR-associated helicase/endonuclease Cas3 [Bacillota bacterium]